MVREEPCPVYPRAGPAVSTMEKLQFERFEYKYFVSQQIAEDMRVFLAPFLRLDPRCEENPGRTYAITNLYWDNPAMDLYWDHMHGSPDRFKLRIRTYGSEPDGPRFFEIKRKVRQVVVKSRAAVPSARYAAVLDGDATIPLPGEQQAYLEDFIGRTIRHGCAPLFLLRYDREAYESVFGDDARATFDRGLCYQAASGPDPRGQARGWSYIDSPELMGSVPDPVLLELKFGPFVPAWMGEFVRHFELRRTQFSKYLSVATHHREHPLALPDDQHRSRRR
jgi:hypothetical protein